MGQGENTGVKTPLSGHADGARGYGAVPYSTGRFFHRTCLKQHEVNIFHYVKEKRIMSLQRKFKLQIVKSSQPSFIMLALILKKKKLGLKKISGWFTNLLAAIRGTVNLEIFARILFCEF